MSIGKWSDKAKAGRDRRVLTRMASPGINADRLQAWWAKAGAKVVWLGLYSYTLSEGAIPYLS